MRANHTSGALFTAGDYLAGASLGLVTAVAVRAVITPEWDMVLAMLVGMVIGMLVHLGVGLLLSPLLGMFHVMVPGSLIGMYGGMLFAMRDSMQHTGPLADTLLVGAAFGLAVNVAVQIYNHILRGPASPNRVT